MNQDEEGRLKMQVPEHSGPGYKGISLLFGVAVASNEPRVTERRAESLSGDRPNNQALMGRGGRVEVWPKSVLYLHKETCLKKFSTWIRSYFCPKVKNISNWNYKKFKGGLVLTGKVQYFWNKMEIVITVKLFIFYQLMLIIVSLEVYLIVRFTKLLD